MPTFTHEVVMIRPENFYLNHEATQDNKFMKESELSSEGLSK